MNTSKIYWKLLQDGRKMIMFIIVKWDNIWNIFFWLYISFSQKHVIKWARRTTHQWTGCRLHKDVPKLWKLALNNGYIELILWQVHLIESNAHLYQILSLQLSSLHLFHFDLEIKTMTYIFLGDLASIRHF